MSKFDFISEPDIEEFYHIDIEIYRKALKTIKALTSEIPIGANEFYKEIKIPLLDYLKDAVKAREFAVTQRPKLSFRNDKCEFVCVVQVTREYYVFKGKEDNRYLQVRFCFSSFGDRIRELSSVSMKHVAELYHPTNGITAFEKRVPTLYIAELNTLLQYVDDFREDSDCNKDKLSNFLQIVNGLADVLDKVIDSFV
jgi:hypothetical protein